MSTIETKPLDEAVLARLDRALEQQAPLWRLGQLFEQYAPALLAAARRTVAPGGVPASASGTGGWEAGAEAMREACAKAADGYAQTATLIGSREDFDSSARDRLFARAREATFIAEAIRALPLPQAPSPPQTAFRIGDAVEKHTGDYQLPGEVRAVFATRAGKVRYVVEHQPGFLHIYGEANLRPSPPQTEA